MPVQLPAASSKLSDFKVEFIRTLYIKPSAALGLKLLESELSLTQPACNESSVESGYDGDGMSHARSKNECNIAIPAA